MAAEKALPRQTPSASQPSSLSRLSYPSYLANRTDMTTTQSATAVEQADCHGCGGRGHGKHRQKKGRLFRDSLIKDWRRPTFPQTSAVSSAMRGLTSLFGMGRGGHPLHSHQNSPFDHWRRHIRAIRKAFGQLVLLGFAIAGSTPAAYQGRRLRPPYDEVSSWGGLRT